jgi:MFS family permease
VPCVDSPTTSAPRARGLRGGAALVLPVVYSVVGNEAPERAGTVIATVMAMGYLGSVAGPPIVGALSSPLGLRAAFLVLPIVAASIGLLALKR